MRLAGRPSCRSPLPDRYVAVVRLERGSHRGDAAMEPGLGGPRGDREDVGYIGEWQSDVMVENENGALIEIEACEPSVDLVALSDR